MKALTVCQPNPFLIVTPAAELVPLGLTPKRVENRGWTTEYRGPLLIHAGLSREWLSDSDLSLPGLVFGALVGFVDLIDCVPIECRRGKVIIADVVAEKYPWLKEHHHAIGPAGLIHAHRFREPIPYAGAQRFFDVRDSLIEEAVQHAEPIAWEHDPPLSHFREAAIWKNRLLMMSDEAFEFTLLQHFPAGSFVERLYQQKGRHAVLRELSLRLAKHAAETEVAR